MKLLLRRWWPINVCRLRLHWFYSNQPWPLLVEMSTPTSTANVNRQHKEATSTANVNRQQIVRARTRVYIYPLYAAIILIRGNKICSLVRCNNLWPRYRDILSVDDFYVPAQGYIYYQLMISMSQPKVYMSQPITMSQPRQYWLVMSQPNIKVALTITMSQPRPKVTMSQPSYY